MEANRFLENLEKTGLRLAFGNGRRFEGEIPVLAEREITVTDGDGRAWRKLLDVAEESVFAGNVIEGQKTIEDLRVQFGGQSGIGEKSFNFRGKGNGVCGERIVEGLDADAVASEKEGAGTLIPNGKSEHAAEFFDAAFAELFVEMDDNFSVGAGFEDVATLQEVVAKFLEIVNFAIENDPDSRVLVGERLMATLEIDDGEAAETKTNIAGDIEAGVVGPAVEHGGSHGFDESGRDSGFGIKNKFSADAAHVRLSPDGFAAPKALELLAAKEADGFGIVEARNAFQVPADIAIKKSERADEVRLANETANAFDGHEKRVIATDVVGAAVFDEASPKAVGGAGVAMVREVEVVKTASGEAEAIGFDFVHGVPTGSRPEAVDGLPAFAAIDFCSAADVKSRAALKNCGAIFDVADDAPADAEIRLLGETAKAFFEIGGVEGEIAVEFDDEVPVGSTECGEAFVEGFDNAAAGFAEAAVGSMDGANPGVVRGGGVNDFGSGVAGTVVDDDPLLRADGLSGHAANGGAKVGFFVANRTDDNVLGIELGHWNHMKKIL